MILIENLNSSRAASRGEFKFKVARNAMIDEKRKTREGKRQVLAESHGCLDSCAVIFVGDSV